VADVNSTFSYSANFGQVQTQIRALAKDITSLNAAFLTLDQNANARKSGLAQSFSKDLGALGGFKTQVVDLTSDVERFGKSLQKNQLTLRQYYKEASQAYKKNSMARKLAEDEVRRAQSQVIGLGGNARGRQQGILVSPLSIDTSDINTKMAIAQKQFSIFNKLVSDGSTQLINWGKNTQWAGRQLTVGLTVPLTIFGAAVSKTFREVDKELTRFAKVYGADLVSANQQATDAMRDQVEQLSKDFAGKYGIAAKETAALSADLAATGLEGQKLLDSVAQTTRLAVLGEIDRQDAMKTTLSLQNAFNMSTTELAQSIDFLNAVENQTSVSLQDLTEAIPKVGPVVNALGGDIKDLSVLLVAMKEGGINAAEGANAIKSGLASLINPTKQGSETAKQYGIDIKNIVKSNKGELLPTLIEFQSQLANLDGLAKAQIIENLFGKYQFARIAALFDNLNASGSQTVEVMKLMGASSADLAKIANGEIRTLTESSAMRFQRSMEAIKASLLPVGETLTNAVIPFLEKTANIINKIVEYAKNLPEPVKNFLKLGVGFTAIAGPIIMLVGVFANFLGYITKSAMMFTKLGAAMAGIKTEKFELLDDTQLAASKASEILALTYNNQTSSLNKLNAAMMTYIANLKKTQAVQANLFAPSMLPGGKGPKPVKKQQGGEAWVPGTGNGDKVPALLEPGEFVVNKKAAKKHNGLLNEINFKDAPRFQNGGGIGLIRGGGKPLFLGMPEKFSEKIGNVRSLLKISDQQAKTGRFASMPLTEIGTRSSSIGGFSSAIPGVNGIYEINGKRYVVKGHTDADSALVESRGTQLTRDIFGLKTPEQEFIKIAHPKTGEQMFAVRSPYDEAFAKSTGKVDPDDFAAQALASIIRRDNDLQPDNLFGNIVTDVGSGFVANKASQPRTVGGPKTPVSEQALINFLAKKGGAKKWFAESTGDIARGTTAQQYESMFLSKIDDALGKTKGAIDKLPNMTPDEKKMYQGIVTDLEDARGIDWKALHAHHIGLTPTLGKPPTAAALAKKQLEAAEKARQKGHAVGTGGMPWAYANGGAVKLIKGGKVKGYDKLVESITKNTPNRSTQPIINWLDNALLNIPDTPAGKKEAKRILDAVSKRANSLGTGFSKTELLSKDFLIKNNLSSRPGEMRSNRRTGSPAGIRALRPESFKDVEKDLEKKIKSFKDLKLSEAQIKSMAKIDAAHLKPDIDPETKEKRYVPRNLAWIPAAENNALQFLTKGGKGKNTPLFIEALKEAGASEKLIKSITVNKKHPILPEDRKILLEALGLVSKKKGLTPKAAQWAAVASRLEWTPQGTIVDKKHPDYNTVFMPKSKVTPRKSRGGSLPAKQIKEHVGGEKVRRENGPVTQLKTTQGVFDKQDIAEKLAQDEMMTKADRKAARGQKAGAVGGLAMTAAFMLPAMTGTNEALGKFTNSLMIAASAVSVLSTIMQVRGIGGGGMSLGKKSRTLQAGLFGQDSTLRKPTRVQGKVGMSYADSLTAAKEKAGAGRIMGGLANKATGTGKGALLARGGLQALTIATGPIGIALVAAIALGTAAWVAYRKSIDNARKAGESLYAEQTSAAQYYGIELKSIGTAMQENVQIAKEMGLAVAPTAATVDPALKQTILDQEENKKLVEEIKKSNDPSSIFLGQYGKMLQQGFNPDQAKEILSVLAQASGKMGALQGLTGRFNATTVMDKNGEVDINATSIKATEAVGEAAVANINNLFTKQIPTMTYKQGVGMVQSGSQVVDRKLTSGQDFANLEGQITEAFKSALMSPDLSTGFETMGKTIEATYAKAVETGTSQADIADTFSESAQAMAKDMGFEEDSKFVETLNSALDDTTDKIEGSKNQTLLLQAAAAGIDLTTIIADGKLVEEEIKQINTELAGIDAQREINIVVNTQISEAIAAIDDEIAVRTAYYDQLEANNQSAQESENERTKNFQKNMEKRNKAIQKEIKAIQRSADEQIKAKEKEVSAIEKSSDAYIKSLQKNKDADNFMSQQSQSALGGLNALASGDLIGFLQAKEDMASNASQYAQQEEIKKIEDVTDAEVTRIEDAIDKLQEKTDAEVQSLQDQLDRNQELMDNESERHEKRMENLGKEARQIQADKAAELAKFNAAKSSLEELMNMPVGEKLGKDLSAYATAISDVAANMPASAQDTMSKLATSFGDNFQSVFDAETQKSAEQYGVNPENLKKLIKASLIQAPATSGPQSANTYTRRADTGGYKDGGLVTGPGTGTSDSIATNLSNGEYVVKADSVRRIGKDTLDKINNGSRVGGGEAIAASAAFAGGVKTAVNAVTAANALVQAASMVKENEEPENSDGGGSGSPSSIPEKLGTVAKILRGAFGISARGLYPSGNKHSARYSTAIDYKTPIGTPVYAMASGFASKKDRGNRSFGKYVTIKHADGTESLYAHLNGFGKHGEVSAGDEIGYTGNSGNSSGPHLHFEWSALKNGSNPPGMRIGGETMSDGLANLHKGEIVLTKPLTQQLKDGIAELKFGMPSMSGISPVDSGTMVSSSNTYNISVDASGPLMDPNKIAQRIVTAISREEDRRSFGRSS
jgi:TP901 family phage tail tape measure protein